MTDDEIIRTWNGPTSVSNRAKILQFAADLEAKRAERPANEKDDEQALRIAGEMDQEALWEPTMYITEFARRLRAESAQEPVARVTYSNWNGMNVEQLPTYPAILPVGTLLCVAPVAKPAAQDCVSVPRDKLELAIRFLSGELTHAPSWIFVQDMRELLAASKEPKT